MKLFFIALLSLYVCQSNARGYVPKLEPVLYVDHHGALKIEIVEQMTATGVDVMDSDPNQRQAHIHVDSKQIQEKLTFLERVDHPFEAAVFYVTGEAGTSGYVGRVLELWRDPKGEFEVARLASETQPYDFIFLKNPCGSHEKTIRAQTLAELAQAVADAGKVLVRPGDGSKASNAIRVHMVVGFPDHLVAEQIARSQFLKKCQVLF